MDEDDICGLTGSALVHQDSFQSEGGTEDLNMTEGTGVTGVATGAAAEDEDNDDTFNPLDEKVNDIFQSYDSHYADLKYGLKLQKIHFINNIYIMVM